MFSVRTAVVLDKAKSIRLVDTGMTSVHTGSKIITYEGLFLKYNRFLLSSDLEAI